MSDCATLALLRRIEAALGLALPHVERVAAGARVTAFPARAAAFHEDTECPRVYLVRSGLFKQLYTREDGSEWIKSFAREGELFACPLALLPGGRTSFASVAIEASVTESIEWPLVEQLAAEDLGWQKAVRLGFQRLAELKVRRERDLLMLSAFDLYRRFVAESPELAARVPQKDLASFLGVTAVGLNRIVRRSREVAAGGPATTPPLPS